MGQADHDKLVPARSIRAKAHSASVTQEVLAGLVERVTFHNAENGFYVLRAKACGHRNLVTTVGHAATISTGEWVTVSGEWVNGHTSFHDMGTGITRGDRLGSLDRTHYDARNRDYRPHRNA